MSDPNRCRCSRCTIRALMGPAVVITIGVLFLLQEMRGGFFGLGNTYPVIFVVIGAILLASSVASTEGHVAEVGVPPSALPPTPPVPPAQSFPGQGQ
jgi:hypothetical protein